jgi:hypothetical protein
LPIFFTLLAGVSIHACRKTGRHIVAMKSDKEIFKSLIEPLLAQPVREAPKKQRLHKGPSRIGDEEPVFDIPKIIARNRYCKQVSFPLVLVVANFILCISY